MSKVKYQHFLPRKHISWFCDVESGGSRWLLQDGVLEDWFSPRKHGGQKYLYESENLPVNYVEKNILGPIERDFFEARERALVHRQLRSAKDRKSVKRYAIAQLLRQKHLHRRMMHLEDDLIFIGKEIGLDLIWGIRGLGIGKKRRRASSVLANSLLEVDSYEKYLDRHAVIFVSRELPDLLLPDSGVMIDYVGNGGFQIFEGLSSPNLVLWIPISPSSAIKIVKRKTFKPSAVMNDIVYRLFIENVCLNAREFIVGNKNVILKARLGEMPFIDPISERMSLILGIYRLGVFDDIIENFHSIKCTDIPKEFVRSWFFREKFVPAVNKLFKPNNLDSSYVIDLKI